MLSPLRKEIFQHEPYRENICFLEQSDSRVEKLRSRVFAEHASGQDAYDDLGEEEEQARLVQKSFRRRPSAIGRARRRWSKAALLQPHAGSRRVQNRIMRYGSFFCAMDSIRGRFLDDGSKVP